MPEYLIHEESPCDRHNGLKEYLVTDVYDKPVSRDVYIKPITSAEYIKLEAIILAGKFTLDEL